MSATFTGVQITATQGIAVGGFAHAAIVAHATGLALGTGTAIEVAATAIGQAATLCGVVCTGLGGAIGLLAGAVVTDLADITGSAVDHALASVGNGTAFGPGFTATAGGRAVYLDAQPGVLTDFTGGAIAAVNGATTAIGHGTALHALLLAADLIGTIGLIWNIRVVTGIGSDTVVGAVHADAVNAFVIVGTFIGGIALATTAAADGIGAAAQAHKKRGGCKKE